MSSAISYSGSYRGDVVEHAVNLSSGGHPQLQITISGLEMYDQDEKAWKDYSQYDVGSTGYMILAGKDGKATKNAEQVMKVFKWDGMSFAGLDAMPLEGMKVQFRIADETYEGKTRQKMVWIDDYDAKPSTGLGSIEKLDTNKLAALDKQFAGTLKGLTGGKIATAKAPSTPPTPPAPRKAVAKAPATHIPDDQEIAEQEAAAEATIPEYIPDPTTAPNPGIITPPAPPKPPAPKKAGRPPKVTAPAPAKAYDANSAWAEIVAQTRGVDDTVRAEAWSTVMEAVCPGKVEKDFTQEEWQAIIKNTIAECATH